METSRQAEASSDNGVDMISNLPDRVLQLFLSRLQGTEEIIRTSILSRRWRYLWTSVSSIDIDYSRRPNPFEEFHKDIFEDFVYRVLKHKSGYLDSFRLNCANYYNMSTIGKWIELAVERKVKRLDLKFCPTKECEDIVLPHCLGTRDSLEELRLFLFGHRLCLHNFGRLPALRLFELNDVKLCDDVLLTNFLESCPLLEHLKLKNLLVSPTRINLDEFEEIFHSSIRISIPKLLFLDLTGHIHYSNFILKGLDSLKKAVIDLNGTPSELMVNTTHELFAGISHVESLSVNPFFVLKCIDASQLPNLKTLELTTTIDDFPMNDLILIVKQYPQLEALHLIIQDVFSYQRKKCFRSSHWKLDEVETRGILTRHLKRVEFIEFNGEDPSIYIALMLLMYGNALEEMVFTWGNKDKYPRKSRETMKKVSTFYKASSNVKLITLLKEKD